jgi:hypothetical protein
MTPLTHGGRLFSPGPAAFAYRAQRRSGRRLRRLSWVAEEPWSKGRALREHARVSPQLGEAGMTRCSYAVTNRRVIRFAFCDVDVSRAEVSRLEVRYRRQPRIHRRDDKQDSAAGIVRGPSPPCSPMSYEGGHGRCRLFRALPGRRRRALCMAQNGSVFRLRVADVSRRGRSEENSVDGSYYDCIVRLAVLSELPTWSFQ